MSEMRFQPLLRRFIFAYVENNQDLIPMQRLIITFLLCLIFVSLPAQETASVYVDKSGVMRWSDTREEASFFGVNYTVPFAHAYRALGYLGKDHKKAIDRDVYHFARLGFNAYRIHIWDVEISDATGNLLVNEHMDLLDYLIYKLKERNIKVVLTAMTTFGNGYPERNQPTGGFSYLYDKCEVHDNPEARKAQQNYIAQLVRHTNAYTGTPYMNDPDIVGFEINNEPCHAGTLKQTKEYIEGMLAAMKKAGNKKPVFYNVSHNMQQIEAYYSTAVQGTTYQWYPIGLVAGKTRKGNFLPYVDNFHIPFSDVKGYAGKARLVYEYDPADIIYSYMHPAMARSFRTAGFQWITQFAYDPIDMAQYNTEYQTHFLNLAYTPQKALSMKIAAEVAYAVPRNKSYGSYPNDTVFDGFRVSYKEDLSEMNTAARFYYSNTTSTEPVAPEQLESVAGFGHSPVISYEGTGAYFIDKLEDGVWRLEVMPDAIQVKDPFNKPALDKEVVILVKGEWDMQINLPNLGRNFSINGLNKGNNFRATATNGTIRGIAPGTYLLQSNSITPVRSWNSETRWNNITLGEFVAPEVHTQDYYAVHIATGIIESNQPLVIEANIAGPNLPDSVLVYTDKVSFWSDRNPTYKMERVSGYRYRTVIPAKDIQRGFFRYNIVVATGTGHYTFPSGIAKNPLDWDYSAPEYWESKVVDRGSAINLFQVNEGKYSIESYSMPEGHWMKQGFAKSSPVTETVLTFTAPASKEGVRYFLKKYIADEIAGRKASLGKVTTLCMHLPEAPGSIDVEFVTNMGYTYKVSIRTEKGINRINLQDLKQSATALLPHSYPIFLEKYFDPESNIPFRIEDIETLEISFEGASNVETYLELGSVWLE